ncbi:hypothetical protein CRUP_021944 [Coryphaenoides rupestris]|nr:hypothetical protein CRUP_021944 [Coryphaenoides rupestris]
MWIAIVFQENASVPQNNVKRVPTYREKTGELQSTVYNKSQCLPRDVLVDVLHEYPEEVEYIYIPSCVVLRRCGGCCTDERMQCTPTASHNTTMEPCSRKRWFVQDPHTCQCSCKHTNEYCKVHKQELNERTCKCDTPRR